MSHPTAIILNKIWKELSITVRCALQIGLRFGTWSSGKAWLCRRMCGIITDKHSKLSFSHVNLNSGAVINGFQNITVAALLEPLLSTCTCIYLFPQSYQIFLQYHGITYYEDEQKTVNRVFLKFDLSERRLVQSKANVVCRNETFISQHSILILYLLKGSNLRESYWPVNNRILLQSMSDWRDLTNCKWLRNNVCCTMSLVTKFK